MTVRETSSERRCRKGSSRPVERSLTWLDARRLRWPAVGLSFLFGLKLLAVSAAVGQLAWIDLPPVLLLACAFGVSRRSAVAAKWGLWLSIYAAAVNGTEALAAIGEIPSPTALFAGPRLRHDPCLGVPIGAAALFALITALQFRSALRRAFFGPAVELADENKVR